MDGSDLLNEISKEFGRITSPATSKQVNNQEDSERVDGEQSAAAEVCLGNETILRAFPTADKSQEDDVQTDRCKKQL